MFNVTNRLHLRWAANDKATTMYSKLVRILISIL
jgi:hypothetical protein